jgi:hypothetical protein
MKSADCDCFDSASCVTGQAADNAGRCALSLLCVLVILGPVLIIIGAVTFGSSNSDQRAILIAEYNKEYLYRVFMAFEMNDWDTFI